ADRHRLLEAHVRPGAAAVGGLVDAVALDDVAAQLRLAHADVHDIGVRLGNGDGADRGGLEEAIRYRAPVDAAVGGLPDATADRAEVVLHRPLRAAGDGLRPAAARGADR